MPETIHATTVAVSGRGVAIRGASGSGKSDLALRLIDRGALLVADDRTMLAVEGGVLIARCPPAIAGLMEVRGVGILPCPAIAQATLALLIDIGVEPRLPDDAFERMHGIAVPVLTIDARLPAAPIKVELALSQRFGGSREAGEARDRG